MHILSLMRHMLVPLCLHFSSLSNRTVSLLQHILVIYFILADLYFLVPGKKLAPSDDLEDLGFLVHAPDWLTFRDCAFTYVAES